MEDKTPPANYKPTAIDRLTTHSVDQQILASLLRIEALLAARRQPSVAELTAQVPQEDPVPAPKGQRRFGGRGGK